MNQEKLDKARALIKSLKEKDYLKLKRSIGIGMYLFNLLRDYLSNAYLDLLKEFDKLSIQKRIAILEQIEKVVDNIGGTPSYYNFNDVPKKPIESFFVDVDRLDSLNTKEKNLLKAFGISDLYSALWFLPVRYEDRRLNTSIITARPGKKLALKVNVLESDYDPKEKYPASVKVSDGTDVMYLRFRFKNPKALTLFKKGITVVVYGTLKEFNKQKYMVHPKILKDYEMGSILPFYDIRGDVGIKSASTKHRKLREIMSKLAQYAKNMKEYLPQELLKKYSFPNIGESLYFLHKPPPIDNVDELNSFQSIYQKRLIYEELFIFQLALKLRRSKVESLPTVVLGSNVEGYIEDFKSRLPFRLTPSQEKVIQEALQDMKSGKPMNRLLQGDVGSGKTVVAMALSYILAKEGYQSAVMVPTEILAFQHYKNFEGLLSSMGVKVGLLVGSIKGSERKSLYKHIREGNIDVVIGTHALIQEGVEFKKLGFVVIDEQHRFGVLQRKILMEKAKGVYPHCLVMSATPIPRTLALSLYGDLDVSVIDQLPQGRKPVITRVFFESEFGRMLELVRKEIEKGNKVYVVYPLIEESQKADLKAATVEYEKWKALFPDKNVTLLHGKMKDEQKQEVLREFKDRGHILISTTVIEVGIDVPEATVMVVESAHKFGLSQLHQLRGRVGRSDRQGFCFLVIPDSLKDSDSDTLRRIGILVRTNDGFKIAEEDLKIRGPGELLGATQSGYFGFNIANLNRKWDTEMLQLAKEDAHTVLENNPKLKGLDDLKKIILRRYSSKMDLGHIA